MLPSWMIRLLLIVFLSLKCPLKSLLTASSSWLIQIFILRSRNISNCSSNCEHSSYRRFINVSTSSECVAWLIHSVTWNSSWISKKFLVQSYKFLLNLLLFNWFISKLVIILWSRLVIVPNALELLITALNLRLNIIFKFGDGNLERGLNI